MSQQIPETSFRLDMEQRLEVVELVHAVIEEPDDAAHAIVSLRFALQALYDAMPTGYGEDRALNEAMVLAEKALGIEKKVPRV